MNTTKSTVTSTPDGRGLSLSNEYVELTVAPRVGGRVSRLRDLAHGVEWLVNSSTKRAAPTGPVTKWASFERGGWDECFPNIATETTSPQGSLRDHGELWSRPWEVVPDAEQLELVAETAGRYTFRRTLRLDGNQVIADYDVSVDSGPAYEFIWSMHPLLLGDTNVEALLSSGTETTVEYSSRPEISPGDRLAWGEPLPSFKGWRPGERPPEILALKLFTDVGAVSTAVATRRGAVLRFEFEPAELPHLGIWLNYGAWPNYIDRRDGDQHVAVEPCMAGTDSLTTAKSSGAAVTLQPGERRTWSVALTLDSARSRP